MDAQTATNVLRWYEELEEQLVYFMKDIPPQGTNLDVWSPALATVIVESCNLIQSVFYHITPDPTAYGSTKKREKLFLSDYAAFYSNRHSLSERRVVIFKSHLIGVHLSRSGQARQRSIILNGGTYTTNLNTVDLITSRNLRSSEP